MTPAVNEASYDVLDLEARAYAQTSPDLGIALDGSVAFSVDAWVRLDGLCSGASILSKEGVFSFGISGEAVVFAIAGYPSVQSNPGTRALDHLSWHYLTATYAAGQVRLYIDGQLNTFQAMSGSGETSQNPFLIGKDLQAHVWSVRVYNEALSNNMVMSNMFEPPASSAIIADFDFSQTPPVDKGPHSLPIILKEGARMIRNTPALSLSGTAFAEPLQEEEVNPGGGQVDPYSVQAWVYVEDETATEQAIFVNSELESDTGIALYLEKDEAAHGFRVVSQRGSVLADESLTSTAVLQGGVWANVATTFDGTTLTIYINGQAAGSKQFGPIPLADPEARLLIGAALSEEQPFGVMTLQGYISRLEVWDTALTAAEVTTYMAAMPPMDSVGLSACYDFTSAQARNMLDSHPVGLADSAEIGEQVQAASASAPAPTAWARPERPAELDDETIRSLVDSIDLTALLDDAELGAAMEADLEVFAGRPEAQDLLRGAWKEAIEQLREDPGRARFLVTSHVLDGEHVVLCHRRGRTHVAFRIGVGEIDECTLWKVELVFIVVAGVLDALFGLSSTLGTRAIACIRGILQQPAIVVLLATGRSMGAAGIFALTVALYDGGFLKALVKLIVDIGFWAMLRLAARLALTLVGLGSAAILASLAATALAFIVKYKAMPQSCSPLPTVELAAIKFDYDTRETAIDALSIRRNYSTPVSVQWSKGMTKAEESPAAYSISRVSGQTVTLQAGFLVSGQATSVQVKAEGGGILGAIDPFTVNLKDGRSDPQLVTIPLNHHTLAAAGIQRQDIQWTWSYQIPGGAWTPMATTSHRVYALLGVPRGPWQQSPPANVNTQLPWTEVLDYACSWAAGKTTVAEAATAITQKVNESINLEYDTSVGGTKYTFETRGEVFFLCGAFLDFLRLGAGHGPIVNCQDCAAIVTTFANSVGCDVFASVMAPPNSSEGFTCNMIQAIGYSNWEYPFPWTGGRFKYHEIVWMGGAYARPVWDACLKFDGGTNPWNWSNPRDPSHVATLPVNLQFSFAIAPVLPINPPFSTPSYRERLATNNDAGIGSCQPVGAWSGTQGGRRKVC